MSFQAPEPPPVYPSEPRAQPRRQTSPNKPKGLWGAILAALAFLWKFILGIGKVLVPILKFGKVAKVLLTGGSMLVSVWYYAQYFGWLFALGFVLCILVHELGHVFFAWKMGLPVSTPVFIPGMGAMILLKNVPRNSWVDAVVGIGGPLFGTLAGLACWALFAATDNYLFLGLAFTGFFMNLFNMTPLFPLDGGRIVGAVSKWLWIPGLVVMITLFVLGIVRNPFIWVLVIMALPHIWMRFKGTSGESDVIPSQQRLIMGAAYVGLAGFLFWAMAATHVDIEQRMRQRATRGAPVASRARIPNAAARQRPGNATVSISAS